MLEWIEQHAEGNDYNAITDYGTYSIIYFIEYGRCFTALWFPQHETPGEYLTQKSLPMSLDRNGYLLPPHKFATKEEAMAVCERHYKLLLLQ